MSESGSDDLFLPSPQDEELVENLLCGDDADKRGGLGFSLTKALLPLVESPCSPPLAPWGCSTRYKTQLCISYSETGSCKYADRCQFAHGLHEIHVPSRHPKYKTELCRNFHATGYCYYGSRCLFVHDPTEQRPIPLPRRNVPCRTFSSFGICPFGTRCNFLHLEDGEMQVGSPSVEKDQSTPTSRVQPHPKEWRPRGALCRTFSTFGFCLYGTSCRFQHGLPNKIHASESPITTSGFLSPTPPHPSTSSSPLPSPDAEGPNVFTSTSHNLSDFLLPLALQLQHLESTTAQKVWDSRGL